MWRDLVSCRGGSKKLGSSGRWGRVTSKNLGTAHSQAGSSTSSWKERLTSGVRAKVSKDRLRSWIWETGIWGLPGRWYEEENSAGGWGRVPTSAAEEPTNKLEHSCETSCGFVRDSQCRGWAPVRGWETEPQILELCPHWLLLSKNNQAKFNFPLNSKNLSDMSSVREEETLLSLVQYLLPCKWHL